MGTGIVTALCVTLYFIARFAQLFEKTPAQARAASARLVAEDRLTKALGELRDGDVVTLVGEVEALAEPILAPISGASCVFYVVNARIWEADGRKRTLIEELHESELVPFRLKTASGIVAVEGQSAETELVPRSAPRNLEREAAFLKAHKSRARTLANVSFDQCVVVPGDRISVHGTVIVERAIDRGETGYRDEPSRIVLVDHPTHRLTIGKPR